MALSDDIVEFWPLTTNNLVGAVGGNTLTAAGGLTWDAVNSCWTITSSTNPYLLCSTLTLSEGFTVAAEVYVGGGAAGDYTFVGYLLAGTNYWHIYQSGSTNLLKARSRSGGSAGDAVGPGVSGSVWNQAAGVFAGPTDRKAFLGSTLSAADTTSITVSGASKNFTIGALFDGSTATSMTAAGFRFRNVAIWSRTLSQAELISYFSDPSQVLGSGGTDATANGVTMTAVSSLVAGTASGTGSSTASGKTLTATASLIAGLASGTIDGTLTIPVVNNTDTALTVTSIPHVVVHKLSDRVEKVNLASQVTDGSGNLVLSSPNLVAGTDYIVTGWNADGSEAFVVKATAA